MIDPIRGDGRAFANIETKPRTSIAAGEVTGWMRRDLRTGPTPTKSPLPLVAAVVP
jgi:hypothetical protein